ncbi:MAG: hypothetical protein AB7P04_09660 [Bacteriovoracia bacterium]
MKIPQTFLIPILMLLGLAGHVQAESVQATLIAKIFKSPEQNIAYITDISISLDRDMGFGTNFPLWANPKYPWLICKHFGLSEKEASNMTEPSMSEWVAYFYGPEADAFGFTLTTNLDPHIIKMATCRIQ